MNKLYPIIRRARRPLIEVEPLRVPTIVTAPQPPPAQEAQAAEETQTTQQAQVPNATDATNGTDVTKDEATADAPESTNQNQ